MRTAPSLLCSNIYARKLTNIHYISTQFLKSLSQYVVDVDNIDLFNTRLNKLGKIETLPFVGLHN